MVWVDSNIVLPQPYARFVLNPICFSLIVCLTSDHQTFIAYLKSDMSLCALIKTCSKTLLRATYEIILHLSSIQYQQGLIPRSRSG